jgi:Ca2+-binding RTX toxin-like protein
MQMKGWSTAAVAGAILLTTAGIAGAAGGSIPPLPPGYSCPGAVVEGDQHDNFLVGTTDRDTIFGYQGNDEIHGSNTFGTTDDKGDCLFGAQGDDRLFGYQNNDYIEGGNGNDTVDANGQHDYVLGGNSEDRLFGGDGMDQLFGENGNDLVNGGPGPDQMSGANGSDEMVSAETLNGNTPAADTVNCGNGPDTVMGDSLDTFIGCENVTLVP